MSDNDPNKALNKKRMSVELSAMKLNIERMDLRIMELETEKTKINENIDASQKRVVELTMQLQEN